MTDRIMSALGLILIFTAAYFLWIATPAWAAPGPIESKAADIGLDVFVALAICAVARAFAGHTQHRSRIVGEDSHED